MTWQSRVCGAKGTMGKSVRWCNPSLLGMSWGASPRNFLNSKTIINAFSCDLKQHFAGFSEFWVLAHSAKKGTKSTKPVKLGLQLGNKWQLKENPMYILWQVTCTFNFSWPAMPDCGKLSNIQWYLIHALVSSRLDFCSSLLAELSGTTLRKLHTIQNSAAQILTCASWYEHITPICHGLHWFPVAFRIKYKVLLLSTWPSTMLLPTTYQTSSSTARSGQDFGPQMKYSLWSQCFASRTMATVPLALLDPHTGIHSPMQFKQLPR